MLERKYEGVFLNIYEDKCNDECKVSYKDRDGAKNELVLKLDGKKQDNVNNPSHYQQGGKETMEIIKDTLATGFDSYLEGNIIKYISRYKYKNGVEDLKKARFYLNRLIKEIENE